MPETPLIQCVRFVIVDSNARKFVEASLNIKTSYSISTKPCVTTCFKFTIFNKRAKNNTHRACVAAVLFSRYEHCDWCALSSGENGITSVLHILRTISYTPVGNQQEHLPKVQQCRRWISGSEFFASQEDNVHLQVTKTCSACKRTDSFDTRA